MSMGLLMQLHVVVHAHRHKARIHTFLFLLKQRISLMAAVILLLFGGGLFLYGTSSPPFPSAFAAEAVHRWQAAGKARIDISDLAQQHFKPGMSASECRAAFLLLGLKEGRIHRPPAKDLPSLIGGYGWSSTRFTLFPEAMISVDLYFSDDKLERARAENRRC